MNKNQRALAAVLVVIVLGAAAWQQLRAHEPAYQGERLTFWLDAWSYTQYGRKPVASREQAEEAVRQMGTNVIPTLLSLLKTRDADMILRNKILVFASRQPWIPFHPCTAEYR